MENFLGLLNSYTSGVGGGDVCFAQFTKRAGFAKNAVVTSALGREFCFSYGLDSSYLITSREKVFKNIIFTYLSRALKAVFIVCGISGEHVVYASSDFIPDVLPAFFIKLKNKNNFWVQKIFHIIPAQRVISNLAQKISFILIRYLADLVIVDNPSLKDYLIARGFPAYKIQVNYPGVDLSLCRSFPAQDKIYDAIFVGRFHSSKGIFDLPRIWAGVLRENPGARLLIVGSGNEKTKIALKEAIKECGLDNNVTLLTNIPGNELIRSLKQSRIFISPSHEEGFGMAILEAMACDLPVVAWDLPVYREVFPGGIARISFGDIAAFAEAVSGLLADKIFYSRLTGEAANASRRYDWETMVSREMAFIKGISTPYAKKNS